MELTSLAIKAMDAIEEDLYEDADQDVQDFWQGSQSSEGFEREIETIGSGRELAEKMYSNVEDHERIVAALEVLKEFETDYYNCFGYS